MNWTIGFITAGTQDDLLRQGIDSAKREAPEAQIVVVGGSGYDVDLHIPFDESQKSGWITRKKNLIAQNAHHENIALLHDYVCLEPGWLQGCDSFGYNWLTCMHRVLNNDYSRYRDWCVIYNDSWMNPPIDSEQPPEPTPGRMMFYGTRGYERWQYYSGTYFCSKKSILLNVPMDEERVMGGGEDVQWSRLLYQEYGAEAFSMNTMSAVRLLKQKPIVNWQHLPCL